MKKIFSLILIMLLAIGGAYALSYSAFITLSSGASFTKVSDEDMLRTSYQLTLEAEPAGIRFGNSSISIPLTLTYFSKSLIYDYYMLNRHLDFGIGLAYRYAFSPLFTLKAKGLVSYRYYQEIDASTAAFTISPAFEFYPADYTAIVLPADFTFTKDEFSLSLGIGCLVHFGGER